MDCQSIRGCAGARSSRPGERLVDADSYRSIPWHQRLDVPSPVLQLLQFLLDEYWRRGRPGSAVDFQSFYRAREFIFSVGAHLCDRPEHAGTGRIVGRNKTVGLASQQLPAYSTAYNYIKSPLGGYGLYYRSVMAELGMIYPSGPGFLYRLDVPSEKSKEVAEAFRQVVNSTRY